MKRPLFLLALSLIALLSVASAESRPEQEKKEEKTPPPVHEYVFVTATLSDGDVRELPASVAVVERREVESNRSANALAALNSLPGLFVRRNGDFGRADVDIRGLGNNSQKIGVLVDGRPEKMSIFGCAVSHTFPLDNVERIEVIKGPASVLYGSDAMAGVVNIFTRRPSQAFEGRLSASYGSYETTQLNLQAGGRKGELVYLVTYDRRRSDGHIPRSAYNGDAATGKIEWLAGRHLELTLQGKYYDGRKHEPGSIERPLPDFWNDYRRGAVDVSARWRGGSSDVQVKAYRNFGRHVFSDGWDSKDHTDGLQADWNLRLAGGNRLTVGADLRRYWGHSYNAPAAQWKRSEAAVFALGEFRPLSSLAVSAGARFQHDSQFGDAVVPQIGMVWHAGPHTDLRANVSGGFRAPQINELFVFPVSNPELRPERLWNYEIGFRHRLGDRLVLSGALFRLHGSNFIEVAANATGKMPPFRFQNTGTITFDGFEIGGEAWIGSALQARAFFSYLDPGDRTKGRPGDKLDVLLRWSGRSVSVDLSGQRVSRYFARDRAQGRLPSYTVIDTRAAWTVNRMVEVFVEFNNIFDEDYLVFLDLPGSESGPYRMPGRHVNVGLRLNF